MRNIVTVLFLMIFSIGIYAQVTPAPEKSPFSGQVTEMYKGFVILNTADAFLEDRLDSVTAGTVVTTFPAETVVITDNESTAENNPIVFVAGAAQAGGNLGLETDGTAYYTPNTGTITATAFVGNITGNVTQGNGATLTNATTDTLKLTETVIAMIGRLVADLMFLTPSDTATAVEGTIYYDADDNFFYGRNNSAWVALDTQ